MRQPVLMVHGSDDRMVPWRSSSEPLVDLLPDCRLHVIGGCGHWTMIENLIRVPLDATALPPGAPGESWLHVSIYARRTEIGAIARAQPPATFPVAAAARSGMLGRAQNPRTRRCFAPTRADAWQRCGDDRHEPWASRSRAGGCCRRRRADRSEIDAWQAVEGDLLPRLWRHLRQVMAA